MQLWGKQIYFGGAVCTHTMVSCSWKVTVHERKNSAVTPALRASSLRLYRLHSRVSPDCGAEISNSCVLIRVCRSSQQPQAKPMSCNFRLVVWFSSADRPCPVLQTVQQR